MAAFGRGFQAALMQQPPTSPQVVPSMQNFTPYNGPAGFGNVWDRAGKLGRVGLIGSLFRNVAAGLQGQPSDYTDNLTDQMRAQNQLADFAAMNPQYRDLIGSGAVDADSLRKAQSQAVLAKMFPPDRQPVQVSEGGSLVDPDTGKVVFQGKPKPNVPSGYQQQADGTLRFIPGGPGDPKVAGALSDARRAPPVTVNMSAPGVQDAVKTAASQAILTGRYPAMSRPTPYSLAIWKEIKNQLEASGDTLGAANAKSTYRAGLNKSLTDNTAQMKRIETFENYVSKNMDNIVSLALKNGAGDIPMGNLIKNAAQYHLGQAEVIALRNGIKSVTPEIAAIISGTTSGNTPVTAMEETRSMFNEDMSPSQIAAGIRQIRLEMKNRNDAYTEQNHSIMSELGAGGAGGGSASAGEASPKVRTWNPKTGRLE